VYARARNDPAFRQQLMASNLEWLLEALKQMRKADDLSPESARQLREASISRSSWPTACSQPPRACDHQAA
jgi:hypothetical protein